MVGTPVRTKGVYVEMVNRETSSRLATASMTSRSRRPLSRSLVLVRDEVLAHVDDPTVPFRRFDVVGDAGSGKSALLEEIAQHCKDNGLLVLNVAAHGGTSAVGDSAQDQGLADLYACSDLIADLVISIDAFRTQNPESRAVTSRAIDALRKARSLNRLHHLVTNAATSVDMPLGEDCAPAQELLVMLRGETESALLQLAHEYKLAILVDDVHLIDRIPVQDWLRELLGLVPTRCTVTARRPVGGSWRQDQAYGEQSLVLQNMTFDEVRGYLGDRRLAFTDDEVRTLFDQSKGHGLSVTLWCDLALDAGGDGLTEPAARDQRALGGADFFTNLTVLVESAVDQIPVDVLGYPVPLFALLTVAEVVTPDLIAMLESDTGQHPSERGARRIYHNLTRKRFIPAVDGNVEKGVFLHRAIRDVTWQRLLDEDQVLFREMHSCAELYLRELVDLEAEVKQTTPFSAWLRFEDPAWLRDVERWLEHATWLDRRQFVEMKPALAKIYLDAFWWWDDYLRSAATSILAPALARVAAQQEDTPWMNALKEFSDHWVSSWDEAVLRANPQEWHAVLDAIRTVLSIFSLQRGRIPGRLELRRIYILLCNFYGKALWYAGNADASRAEKADEWLAAALAACATQPGETDEQNPNGWIGDWALLRRAEIWSTLDPQRSSWYLKGLDRKAIDGGDNDLRVGIGVLIGDLRWRGGELALALDAYARTLLISYAYNTYQELRRKAPNLYTKSLYASVIGRVEKRIAELEQAGEIDVIDAALATMRQLFKAYWDRVRSRPNPPPPLSRFALPVPPPPEDHEISMLESESEENYALENEYAKALLELAESRTIEIQQTIDLPLGGDSRRRQRAGMRIYEAQGSGPVIEALYHQILKPSFPPSELVGIDELQEIAARDSGSVWLAEDTDGIILGGAVGEWDESVRVMLLGYLAVRPGDRGGGIGGPLYLASLQSWRQRFKPCLVLAEIEDPAAQIRSSSEDYGDAAARLRFYINRGARILDFPYFQPALEPGAARVTGLLLVVLHADPELSGTDDNTIDSAILRGFLENYQSQYEGKVATDDQAMEMWRALDCPEGVRLREQ